MDPVLAVPLSFHNFLVAVLCIPVLVWALQIGHRLLIAVLLHWRLNFSRPLVLQRMSIFADDFQQLIRQHFNQILRIRRTVPSKIINQVQLIAHVQPENLTVQVQADPAGERIRVQFSADASQPCTVSVFWGVTGMACHELLQSAERFSWEAPAWYDPESAAFSVFSQGQYAHRSTVSIPGGLGQPVTLDEDLSTLKRGGYDLLPSVAKGDRSRIPLVICAGPPGRVPDEKHAIVQMTLVRFRSMEMPLQPEVFWQLVVSKDMLRQILGVYGFEEGEAETECMVCYDRPRSVIVLPCRHCYVCPACLRSLREEKCPMCRSTFSAFLLLPLLREDSQAASSGRTALE